MPPSDAPPRNVFFVCGAPKSGTTWLQRVLDAHPEVTCGGEGHFMQQFSTPLAKVIREYNDKLKLVAGRVYEGKPYYPMVDQAEFDEIVRTFAFRRMSLRAGPQVRWVGDKTPSYASFLPRLLRYFPEAKFIEIVRDPRDVEMSRLHHAQRGGVDLGPADSPKAIEFIRNGGKAWANFIRPVREFEQEHPDRLVSVRYEAMIADPAGEARKVFGFLGVSCDDAVIAEVVRTTSFEAQTGRQRGEEDASAFVRKGVVGDWVGRLPPPSLAALDDACGPLMRQLGYQ